MFLRAIRDLGKLLFDENLQVKRRVGVAPLVDGVAKRRQMVEVGLFKAAQEHPDRGDAAEHGGPGLGMGFFPERHLIADVHMGVDESRQYHFATGVEGVGGRLPDRAQTSPI